MQASEHDVYRGVYYGAYRRPTAAGSVYGRPPLGWAERLMYRKQEENSGRTCRLRPMMVTRQSLLP